MGHEAAAGAKAIKANLAARAALVTIVTATIGGSSRVQFYGESAPQDAVEPYVVFRQRSPGEDSQVINPKRVMTSPLIDVGIWVVDDPYSSTAQSGAKQIDVALGSLGSYSVTDANSDVWEVSARSEGGAWIREEPDKETKKKYYWVGRSYRLSISAA
jgi:hypothetical protein